MDAVELTRAFALTGIAIAVGWFVLTSLGQAGDAFSGALTTVQPVGVRQARQPTGSWWLTPRPLELDPLAPYVDIEPANRVDLRIAPRSGRFVVPLIRVAPIRLRVLAA
jgi:hypothetical protein